jgi:hypothetical protein
LRISAGGAIDNFGGGSLTVTGSTFSNNRAESAGGAVFGIGGAVENNAGLNSFDPMLASPSTATFTNCTFQSNVATGGPGAIANGGALCNEGFGTIVTLADCKVDSNRSVGGGGNGPTGGNSQGIGGGLLNGLGTLNVARCQITNNFAQGGANAQISASDPDASGAFGGGIENNFLAVLNIRDSIIAGNVAHGGAMTTLPGQGGIAAGGGISNSPSATMTMKNCLVSDNSAVGGNGNAGINTQLAPDQQAGYGFGGGIDVSNDHAIATIGGSMVTGNRAIGGAGGPGANGGNGLGGGIGVGQTSLQGSAAANGPDGSQLSLSNSLVSNNEARGGAGGTLANGGNGFGGGLVVTATCSATVVNSSIKANLAQGGAQGSGGLVGQGKGGGVYYLGTFFFSSTDIDNNHASTSNDDIFP